MGCICGKPLVKSSIEKVSEAKQHPVERENSNFNAPLQETSNESDRILISQQLQKPIRKSKTYEFSIKPFVPINLFPLVQRAPQPETSQHKQWTKLLLSHKEVLQVSLKPVKSSNSAIFTEWDKSLVIDLSLKILQLPARDWAAEQVILLQKDEKSGKSRKKQALQLRSQLQWFMWAVRNVWVLFMGGKGKKVTEEFQRVAGTDAELPDEPVRWFEGFEYRNVKFLMVYRGSEWAKQCKSEIKAMKNLYLDSFGSGTALVFPSVQCITAGQFLLITVPLYSDSLLSNTEDLHVNLFSDPDFIVPNSSLFKLNLTESVFLVHSCSNFLFQEPRKSIILHFNSETQAKTVIDNFYEKGIPKKDLIELLYPENAPAEVSIKQKFIHMYGWDCCVFWDSKNLESKHEFSEYFENPTGSFVVFFFEDSSKAKRQVDVHISKQKNAALLKMSLKDCVNILEQKEAISTQHSLKELIHRKGLRSYHQWIIYSKCRSQRTASLLEASLLVRAIKKCVFSEILTKQCMKTAKFTKALAKYTNDLLTHDLCYSKTNKKIAFMLFIDRLTCLNDVLRISSKSDISSSRIIDPIPVKIHSTDFLKTSEIIEKIMKTPSRHPKTFLRALENQLSVAVDPQVLIKSCNDSYDFLSQPTRVSQSQLLPNCKLYSLTSIREEAFLLLLGITESQKQSEDVFSSMNDSQILMFHKESELSSLELIFPGDLYSKNSIFFSDNYSMPSMQILQDWLTAYQSSYKNILTPTGEESVFLEILITLTFAQTCLNRNSDFSKPILQNALKFLEDSLFLPADLVISFFMSNGICLEPFDHSVSEQSYLTALLLMTRVYGDPRGRKNAGVPWQMTAAWKLSKLAREEKRIHDAQLAEEHFDSVYMNTYGFLHSSQKKYTRSSVKQQASIFSSPFDENKEPLWEDLFTWILNNSLCMYSSGIVWNKAEIKEFIKLTHITQLPSQMINTSGASTPSSYKESKRASQSSLSQALIMQEFSLNLESVKGVVLIWGSDTDGQLGVSSEQGVSLVLMYPRILTALKDVVISEIAAGALHCIAISVEGNCYAWGNNEECQLGLGPDMPKNVASPVLIKAINHVKSAACGYQHTIFLNFSGNILTAGLGEGGVLGHSNSFSCPYPKTILSMNKIQFSSVQAGGYHSLALSSAGQVFVWGRGEGGQLGLEQEELIHSGQDLYIDCPTRILSSLHDQTITQIACGEAHNLALNTRGQVFTWGWGSNGQLGNGYREEDFEEAGNSLSIQYTPVPITSFTVEIKQIAAGGLFSMFVSSEHEVYICGANDKRQLGLEMETKDVAIPTKIECFTGYPIDSVACGESHCVAVAEQLVWTWGNHLDHRLGLGEVNGFSLPRLLQTLTNANVSKVSCGRMHSMALIGNSEKIEKKATKEFLSWKIEI